MALSGVVVIGRNEGERLVGCLRSIEGRALAVVYVDSGSVDGSAERARDVGAMVVELDPRLPFTPGRGRNAGFQELVEAHPEVEFVQFVDGDCEVQPGWLGSAAAYLEAHSDVGIVCGRRRERYPGASPYNLLADLEWDTPAGETTRCGGDAMVRARAFRQVGGYTANMIAGEEPELCLRVRRAGYRIVRLDLEMTLHDAAMTRFTQWWQRSARSGHAYAELVSLHGRGPERYGVRQLASIIVWGAGVSALSFGAAFLTSGMSLLLLLAYGALWLRVYYSARRDGRARGHASLYASACTLGKFSELQGILKFAWNRWIRQRVTPLIEYKRAG